MGTIRHRSTAKPVQPTEIKDIKIVRDVIAQIRKSISLFAPTGVIYPFPLHLYLNMNI
ncbi:hypothetical protein AGMMS49944_21340 [Spirochaetia bacterium]|nr:hypothetical protein AGMMS49944_21340 [Spirochaetia bacterium]